MVATAPKLCVEREKKKKCGQDKYGKNVKAAITLNTLHKQWYENIICYK